MKNLWMIFEKNPKRSHKFLQTLQLSVPACEGARKHHLASPGSCGLMVTCRAEDNVMFSKESKGISSLQTMKSQNVKNLLRFLMFLTTNMINYVKMHTNSVTQIYDTSGEWACSVLSVKNSALLIARTHLDMRQKTLSHQGQSRAPVVQHWQPQPGHKKKHAFHKFNSFKLIWTFVFAALKHVKTLGIYDISIKFLHSISSITSPWLTLLYCKHIHKRSIYIYIYTYVYTYVWYTL